MRSSLISLKKKRFFSFFFGFFLVLAPSLEASGRFISTDRPKRKTHTQGPLSFSLSFIHSFILSLSSSLSVWLENVHAPGRWPSVVHLVPNETPRSGSLATFWNIDKKKKAKKKKKEEEQTRPNLVGWGFILVPSSFFCGSELAGRRCGVCVCSKVPRFGFLEHILEHRKKGTRQKPGGLGLLFWFRFFFGLELIDSVRVFQSASIWLPGTHFGTSKKQKEGRTRRKPGGLGLLILAPLLFLARNSSTACECSKVFQKLAVR